MECITVSIFGTFVAWLKEFNHSFETADDVNMSHSKCESVSAAKLTADEPREKCMLI